VWRLKTSVPVERPRIGPSNPIEKKEQVLFARPQPPPPPPRTPNIALVVLGENHMMSRLFSLLVGTTTAVLLLLVLLVLPVATTAFVVVGRVAEDRAGNSGSSSLSALDPKKEIGVLAPIGFFE
jgi:hypothetical protein